MTTERRCASLMDTEVLNSNLALSTTSTCHFTFIAADTTTYTVDLCRGRVCCMQLLTLRSRLGVFIFLLSLLLLLLLLLQLIMSFRRSFRIVLFLFLRLCLCTLVASSPGPRSSSCKLWSNRSPRQTRRNYPHCVLPNPCLEL
jgi:hypothetical protein